MARGAPRGGFGKRGARGAFAAGRGASQARRPLKMKKELKFDPDDRREFLTGFHRRKVERRKSAMSVIHDRERALKVEWRREVREERHADWADELVRKQEAQRQAVRRLLGASVLDTFGTEASSASAAAQTVSADDPTLAWSTDAAGTKTAAIDLGADQRMTIHESGARVTTTLVSTLSLPKKFDGINGSDEDSGSGDGDGDGDDGAAQADVNTDVFDLLGAHVGFGTVVRHRKRTRADDESASESVGDGDGERDGGETGESVARGAQRGSTLAVAHSLVDRKGRHLSARDKLLNVQRMKLKMSGGAKTSARGRGARGARGGRGGRGESKRARHK